MKPGRGSPGLVHSINQRDPGPAWVPRGAPAVPAPPRLGLKTRQVEVEETLAFREGCWGHGIQPRALCPALSSWSLQPHLESLGIPKIQSSRFPGVEGWQEHLPVWGVAPASPTKGLRAFQQGGGGNGRLPPGPPRAGTPPLIPLALAPGPPPSRLTALSL